MGQVLYRKYRSKSLDEIVGQEHITTTLKNALKKGAISHAYLFTGPRGVGKTSIARILAHELNGFDYTGEDMHLDIIEIDAASNRGIDEIRELREKVAIAPARGKYKVYIIDEVHMLTTPAFNALLKTLEEPPAHVVFILATTEVHKLPETIVSRTQRYTFRPVEQAKVINHLKHIAKQEKITIDDEALALIAAHGEGSFRDSISLLDQAASRGDAITADIVREILGIPAQESLQDIIELLTTSERAQLVSNLAAMQAQGYQAATIAKELSQLLRQRIIDHATSDLDTPVLLDLLRQLIDVPASPAPDRLLEITLLRTMISRQTVPAVAAPAAMQAATPRQVKAVAVEQKSNKPISKEATEPAEAPLIEAEPQPAVEVAAPIVEETEPAAIPAVASDANAPIILEEVWPQLLQAIKKQYNTVYGILRMGRPELNDMTLTITFQYAFHQKRIHEVKHRQIISDAIEQLTGQKLAIVSRHDASVTPPKPMPPADGEIATALMAAPAGTENSPLSTISNIFGGGELLES